MPPEVSVERQFHFHCFCGATMVTGERTVRCTGCGVTLGVHRVRRHRQQRRDAVTYYGYGTNGRIRVRRVERPRQQPSAAPAEPHGTHTPEAKQLPPTARQQRIPVTRIAVDSPPARTWWERFVKRHIIDDYPYSDNS